MSEGRGHERVRVLIGAILASAMVRCAASATRPPAAPSVAAIDEVRTVVAGGRDRRYRLFVPPSVDPKRPTPLVTVLHGGLMTFDRIVEGTGFGERARRAGFIVAYPKS